MIKILYLILLIVVIIPLKIVQTISALLLKARGYKYVPDKNGFYYWTK